MCGIAGFAWTDGPAEADSIVRSMLPPLERRGPDGEGIYAWPHAVFGHRRLAIIDLSPAGAQPMISGDGRIGVVFNGCIYNFRELRRELEQKGHSFRSNCDTEILIEGYRAWGIDRLLPRLQGMFAFAIWDENRRMLTLARDRLGVKPLLYSVAEKGIAFASTLDALRAGGLGGSLDPDSVLEYLDLGFVTEERCILKGVSKLPAGSCLEWSADAGGEISQRVYWTLPEADEASPVRFEEAVEETERLLIEAVERRLVSDVPIGVLLSGGIDSTLICWALRRLKADVRAFTVGTPGDPEDESASARETARRLGIFHEVVSLGEDETAPFDELASAYSEPFASSSALGMLRVSRAVKGKATVLLTGDGGDDIFLGYDFFHNAWRAQELARRLPSFSPALWRTVRPLARRIGPLRRPANFLDYVMGGIGAYLRVRRGLPWFEERGLAGSRLKGRGVAYRQVPASLPAARRLMAELIGWQKKLHFSSEFLVKVDGGTMYHSLEARSPLLDHTVWEFAARLPPAIHFHGGRPKAILREIVRRHVGEDVAYRQKQGFTIPVEKWLASKWRGRLTDLKGGTLLEREGWIDGRALSAAIDEALRDDAISPQLWHTFALEQWLQRHSSAPPVHSVALTGSIQRTGGVQ